MEVRVNMSKKYNYKECSLCNKKIRIDWIEYNYMKEQHKFCKSCIKDVMKIKIREEY
jgi:hypothetical protein